MEAKDIINRLESLQRYEVGAYPYGCESSEPDKQGNWILFDDIQMIIDEFKEPKEIKPEDMVEGEVYLKVVRSANYIFKLKEYIKSDGHPVQYYFMLNHKGNLFSNDIMMSRGRIYKATPEQKAKLEQAIKDYEEKDGKDTNVPTIEDQFPQRWWCKPETEKEARILGEWFDENKEGAVKDGDYYKREPERILRSGLSNDGYGFGKKNNHTPITFNQFKYHYMKEEPKQELIDIKEVLEYALMLLNDQAVKGRYPDLALQENGGKGLKPITDALNQINEMV